MGNDPCIDLLKVFEESIREVGGDEMLAEYRAADRAKQIKMADEVMAELDLKVKQQKLRALAWNRLQKYFDKASDKADALNDIISGGGIRQAGTISLENRIDAILGQAHAKLYKMMENYRPRKLGLAHTKKFQRSLIREIFNPGSTGDKDAAQYASMWLEVTEGLRQRFNKAGGGIQKLFDWNLPQYHDAVKINRVLGRKASDEEKFTAWYNDIIELVDRDRIAAYQVGEGEIKGAKMSDEHYRNFLHGIWENLRSDGIIQHKNAQHFNPHIRRAVGNRHQQHRLIPFKDADSWMKYADKYGSQDYFNSMMSHLELMAREIGAMEMFGPNPDTMVKQLRLMVQQSVSGLKARQAGAMAMNSYQLAMGRMFSQNIRFSDMMRAMRNVTTGIRIGSATISAISDLAFMRQTARFNDIPVMKTYMNFLRNITQSKDARMLAARLGLMAEYAIDRAKAAHRISEVQGYGATARFADFIVRASGLNHWTMTAKQTFGLEFLATMSDMSTSSWDNLKPRMKKAFERYDITPEDWVKIQQSERFVKNGTSFIDPANFGDNDLTAKVIGMIKEETTFAVPEPNAKARGILTGGQEAGTPGGELIRLVSQFKSFPVSVVVTHLARGLNQNSLGSKMGYLASLIGGTTLLGAMALQAKQIAAGKTPMEMDEGFWASAFAQGGGMGILGDFLFMDHSRFGAFSEYLLGPTIGQAEILARAFYGTGAAAMDARRDAKDKLGAAAAQAIRDFTPTVWYTRLVTHRYLTDWVNQMVDPNWHRKQRTLRRRMKKEYNNEYWWRPGEYGPRRLPIGE